MKLPLICTECVMTGQFTDLFQEVEVQEGNLYELVCRNGHQSSVIVQTPKFEMLFEIGAAAILDGYYREAISSFAASLERLYEFFVTVALIQREIPDETIASLWKQANLSERQLGAFIVMYTLETGQAPPLLSGERTKFRNKVIHQGRIPTRAEAISFGQDVLQLIRDVMLVVAERLPRGMLEATMRPMVEATRKRQNTTKPAVTMAPTTIVGISVSDASHHTRSLAEALQVLEQNRRLMRNQGYSAPQP